MRFPFQSGAVFTLTCCLHLAAPHHGQGEAGQEFSEDWRWTSFDTSSGLPSADVVALVEIDGVPIVATSQGIASYDGWRWHDIGREHGLGGQRIITLTKSVDSRLWTSTTEGLFVREGEEFLPVEHPEACADYTPVAVAHAEDGTVFATFSNDDSTSRITFARRAGAWREVTIPKSQGGLGTENLEQSGDGSAWLMTQGGAFQYQAGEWKKRLGLEGDPYILLSSFFQSSRSNGLLGIVHPFEYRGLYELDSEGQARRVETEGLGIANFIAVSERDEALVVYDTFEARLRVDGQWKDLALDPSLASQMTVLSFRPGGDLWIGTKNGLHLLRRSLARWSRLYHEGFNDPRNRVNEIFVSSDAQLWTGHTDGVEVRELNGTSLEITLPRPDLVTGIGQDEDGVVWVSSGGSFSGLHGWDGEAWTRLQTDTDGNQLGLIHKIRTDASRGLWLLSLAPDADQAHEHSGGVHRLIAGRAERWEPAASMGSTRVYDFVESKSGDLWFATSSGLHRFRDGSWKQWSSENGLRETSMFRIRARREGGIWFAHPSAGIGTLVDEDIDYLDFGSYQPGRTWDIAPRGNELWATTDAGLLCFLPDETITSFDLLDGLKTPLAWPVVPTETHILVGTMGGGTYVLDRAGQGTPAPRTFFLEARAGELSPAWSVASYWGEESPDRIEARYRFDAGPWSAYSRARETSIEGLSPGKHVLEVQARNLFGDRGPIASTTLEVALPFHRRTAFLLPIASLTLALIVVGCAHLVRRRTDALAIKRSEAEHRILMEEASDAIFVCDRVGIVRRINRRARELFGDEEALVGCGLASLASDIEGLDAITHALKARTSQVLSLSLRGVDQTDVLVEANIKRVAEDRIQAIVRDLTQRQALEEERKELERQVTEGQKLESLGRLAGGLAHDFNNLLMLVMGHTDQARYRLRGDAIDRDATAQDMDEVIAAAKRAGELTQKLLSFSGKESMEPRPIDLTGLVRELDGLLQSSVRRDLVVSFDLAQGELFVEADPTRIQQVVLNLVSNASEAMGDSDGRILVRTRAAGPEDLPKVSLALDELDRSGNFAILEVVDEGAGMDRETQRRIFDPFYTTKFAGRGLGLAAVRGIVRNHRGAIHVESQVGTGTTISILLPTTDALAVKRSSELRHRPPEGERILVIDDDAGVRRIVGFLLQRAGYEPVLARDGEHGVELFREEGATIACALVDLTMPNMDGLETRNQLLQIDPKLPVVLMSGYSEELADAHARHSATAAFLQKPFSAEELLTVVQESSRSVAAGEVLLETPS